MDQEELAHLQARLEEREPEEIVAWAVATYGERLVLASSFGAEDVCLVDMLLRQSPRAHIFYLDTDLLFRETYETRDRLAQRYGVRFIRVPAALTLAEQSRQEGPELWRRNPDLCCEIRKVRPLKAILAEYDAWMTGIRREQAPTRRGAKPVEWDAKFGLVKVNPLVRWTWDDVWAYIRQHDVPYNPMHERGYPSIGCIPCTRAVRPGEDPRAGRWAGTGKIECGLHQ